MSTTTDQLQDAVVDLAHALMCQDRRLRGEDVPDDEPDAYVVDDDDDDPHAWLGHFLEWDWLRNRRGEIRQHVLLATVGGPAVWAEIHSDGRCEVRGEWGSDEVVARGRVDALVAWLDDLADACTPAGWS